MFCVGAERRERMEGGGRSDKLDRAIGERVKQLRTKCVTREGGWWGPHHFLDFCLGLER